MAFGSIEITTITRAQDYTAIKHNEDNKPLVNQTNIGQQIQKDTDQKAREVRSSDNSDWQNKKFDAREKGKGEYQGDGGRNRRRKAEEPDAVKEKGHRSFDIKI